MSSPVIRLPPDAVLRDGRPVHAETGEAYLTRAELARALGMQLGALHQAARRWRPGGPSVRAGRGDPWPEWVPELSATIGQGQMVRLSTVRAWLERRRAAVAVTNATNLALGPQRLSEIVAAGRAALDTPRR